jgi:hypothetical protein
VPGRRAGRPVALTVCANEQGVQTRLVGVWRSPFAAHPSIFTAVWPLNRSQRATVTST